MGLDSPDHTKSGPSGARFFWHDFIRREDGWSEDLMPVIGLAEARPGGGW